MRITKHDVKIGNNKIWFGKPKRLWSVCEMIKINLGFKYKFVLTLPDKISIHYSESATVSAYVRWINSVLKQQNL